MAKAKECWKLELQSGQKLGLATLKVQLANSNLGLERSGKNRYNIIPSVS